MNVTHKLMADLLARGVADPVHAVQCDANTRAVAVTLTAGGVAWEPPEKTTISVAFKKPDGKKGWYDKLPDGSPACSVSGNVVTAILAPEVLTAAGKVDAVIVFQDQNLNQLATFGFAILAEPNPAAGRGISNDYYAYSTMEDVSRAVDAMLDSLEGTKADIGQLIVQVGEAVSRAEQEAGPAIVNQASGEVITVEDSSDRLLQGLRVFGKTLQNGTPSPDVPVPLESAGAGGSVGLTVAGKNLIPFPYISADKTENGLIFTVQSDGGVRVSGTAAKDTWFNLCKIHFSNMSLYAHANYTDGVVSLSGSKNDVYVIYYGSSESVSITVNAGKTVNEVIYPQMEYGTVQTAYEPYKGQVLTVSTLNGLPGIPVASGGNCTDASGQQWICDEVDFARGVYVQRVKAAQLSKANTWQWNTGHMAAYTYVPGGALTDNDTQTNRHVSCAQYEGTSWVKHGPSWGAYQCAMLYGSSCIAFYDKDCASLEAFLKKLGDSVLTVQYILAAPIETVLSAEELAAYAALHTNKPNTTVHNDAGAHMELSYVADTKLYIDQKFTELENAILSAGANL